jgi:uncharacterized protein (DUF4415 family)
MKHFNKPYMPDEAEEAEIRAGAALDPDAPIISEKEMLEFRPASEMLPMIFGEKGAGELVRRRGRPAQPITKVAVNVRYDPDVIDAFRATGEGWQTRMNAALREYAAEHGMFDKKA